MIFEPQSFVEWFRCAAPYVYAFRGRTFVIAFGGEVVSEGQFTKLAHDLALLNSVGVQIVLVHGTRPQIESCLAERQAQIKYVGGLRVTDLAAMECVKEAAGKVRVEIEACLSLGLDHSPMANAEIRVASGNFVTAKPAGVREGVDLLHTGEVRKIDAVGVQRRLKDGDIVLLSPLGYSPTGEAFNLTMEDVATKTAIALGAEKLIFLMETAGVADVNNDLLRELTASQALTIANGKKGLQEDVALYLPCAIQAAKEGVTRCHLISRHVDGALLLELFTRDGIGTMVSDSELENLRPASIDDVAGILALIEPLEKEGILVRRSRELLEIEVERFLVLEHDHALIGCAALYPFSDASAELACFVIHPDYRSHGKGASLLAHIENAARANGIAKLFVLTTHAAHWFIEHGFTEVTADHLPEEKKLLYNWQRRSKVFRKSI